MRIVVAGGGIGGLALAIGLRRRGIPCVVLERDRVLGSSGGGLQLSPNATAVLRRLGLGAALGGAFRPAGRQFRRWRDGGLLGRVPLGRAALSRYGDPYVTLRRSTLRRLLYDVVASSVRLGRAVTAVAGPGVTLPDGTFEPADVLIGADGLNSTVRPGLIADPLRFSGHVAYRAVVPASLLSTVDVIVWLGPGRHCVCYPIDEGRSLNVVATLPAAVPPRPARGVRADELLPAYAGWDPTVLGLLSAAGSFDRHPLFERPAPSPRARGKIALLGDAARPMLPFLAQGACQALEDAESLAAHIAGSGGLAAYAAERHERAEQVAAASRAGAHDNHLADGAEQRRRDRHLAGLTLTDMDWIYASPGRVPA
ncbi:FAD-dependent monooxygenase [Actinoplanes sp. NPDC051343]|uniref:FAD-dependent monooxygenase n=1 Tax=Actinoplanes sp. NPDC051343 TaxID=3363906 RepID=UPI00379811F4